MKKHLVVWQKLKEVADRYTNNKANEINIGFNPDVLPESANPYYINESNELNEKMQSLIKSAKTVLNKTEWNVFNLLTGFRGQPPMTQKLVATKLGITQGRVSQLWESVRTKLCKEWEK